MRFYVLLILILSITMPKAYSQMDTRWKELMHIVNKELVMIKKSKSSPRIEYRKLELYTEKLKLVQQLNNHQFMEYVKSKKPKRSKDSFFTDTKLEYERAKNYGLSILKANPRHPYRPHILIVMGFNSRDYGNDKITEKFLSAAIKHLRKSKTNQKLRHQTESALAELYFNDKQYDKAKRYYTKISKDKNNPWLAKNILNLAWCEFKLKNFDRSVALMKYAHSLSKYPKYIKVEDQVNDHLGPFFVVAGRPLEALDFYLKYNKDPVPHLFSLASKAAEKGYSKEAELILQKAQDIIREQNLYQHQEEMLHAYLDFYRQYNRFQDHALMSKKVTLYYEQADNDKTNKLKKDKKEEAVTKLSSAAGFLQVKLVKDMKENKSLYSQEDMKLIQIYFDELIKLNPGQKSEYLYFKGESFYSVRDYKSAAAVYQEAIAHAMSIKKPEEAKKPLNSLLSVTAQNTLPEDLNRNYLIFAYWHHINLWPKDEKSRQIYPKLFLIYNQSGDDKKAAGVLVAYNKIYPEDLKVQQDLMTRVLDLYIERKDTEKLTYWVSRFKSGFLNFDKKTVSKAETALGNLLFLKYQNIAKEGKHLEAAQGFQEIYKNKLFATKVKSQAAFFAAMAFLEAGDTKQSYRWQKLADKKMGKKARKNQIKERIKIAERTYQLQDFVTAYRISKRMLRDFCDMKDKSQQRFYEIAVMTSLVEDKVKDAEGILNTYSKCLSSNEPREIALAQIFHAYEKNGDFNGLTTFYKNHPSKSMASNLNYTLQKWYWKSDSAMREKIMSELKYHNIAEAKKWIKEIDLYYEAVKKKKFLEDHIVWNKPVFDGDAFNKALESYLLEYQNFKTKYHKLTESGQVDLAIASTKMFADLYGKLGEKIYGLSPQGMDEKTLGEFQGAMKGLSGQFTNLSKVYNEQLDKSLRETEALAWVSRSTSPVADIENPLSATTGFTMDMGKGL
jgi:hypothetical protein